MKIEGEPADGKKVEYLDFSNLSFQHTDWHMDRGQVQDAQAGEFLKDATVLLRHARECMFERCEIAHTGGYALWLRTRLHRRTASRRCHLHDLGAGGVRDRRRAALPAQAGRANRGKQPSTTISSTTAARFAGAGTGVFLGHTAYNQISHNEICDLYYSGVCVGWVWGFSPSAAHHNRVPTITSITSAGAC